MRTKDEIELTSDGELGDIVYTDNCTLLAESTTQVPDMLESGNQCYLENLAHILGIHLKNPGLNLYVRQYLANLEKLVKFQH